MRISDQKKEKIVQQILHFLYQSFPKNPFTAEIAREIARDEEFVKKLLLELKKFMNGLKEKPIDLTDNNKLDPKTFFELFDRIYGISTDDWNSWTQKSRLKDLTQLPWFLFFMTTSISNSVSSPSTLKIP